MNDYVLRLTVHVRAAKISDVDDEALAATLLEHHPEVTSVRTRLIRQANSPPGRPPGDRMNAMSWLSAYLVKAGAPVPARQVKDDATRIGIAPRTLRRACLALGVVKNPPGGGSAVKWSLPKVKNFHV
jgi:hypothetical protein